MDLYMNKILLFISIFAIAGLSFLIYKNKQSIKAVPPQETGDKTARFDCPGGKYILATFHLPEDKTVDIALSDGRNMTLDHAISASGARYTNNDESFVFWNKGDSAFITEGDKTTFDQCITASENN